MPSPTNLQHQNSPPRLPLPPHCPRRLSDLVGADVGLHVGKNILDSFPERSYPARIIQLLNEHKRLGEKSGAGFYKYDARRRAAPDPALAPLVQQSRKVGGVGWGGVGWGGGRERATGEPEGQQHGSSGTALALLNPPALNPLPSLPSTHFLPCHFCVCVCLPFGPLLPPCRARGCTRRAPLPPR